MININYLYISLLLIEKKNDMSFKFIFYYYFIIFFSCRIKCIIFYTEGWQLAQMLHTFVYMCVCTLSLNTCKLYNSARV